MRKIIFSLLVLLSFFTSQFQNVNAGDRKILVERFTSSTCVPCANANPILEAFLNSSDPTKVTNISYHMNWPAPGNDPMYLFNQLDNNIRRTAYGVNAIPDWFFDGVINVDPSTSALQAAYNERVNILSPVTIIVSQTNTGNNVTVKADIYCEGLLTNPNVTVQFAVIEKTVFYNGPNGEHSYTGVMRKMLPSANGTPVVLLPGNKVSLEYSYTMDASWNSSLIKNLVFVQASPLEILNCSYPTPDFNLISNPGFKVVNQGQNQNASFKLRIPSVAEGYNSAVTFTSEVVPSTPGITVNYTGGNVINNFPDSLAVNVSSTAGVPVGEYQIVLIGTNADGVVHKTFVNYLVGKNYITVASSKSQLLYKVDNSTYSSSRAFSWDINSTHTLEAISPQTFGNTRYVFNNWSNGGPQVQTVTIGTLLSDYTANYKAQFRLLGAVDPAGLPVTISGANSYFDSASVNNITLSATQVQYNGKTYYFNRWEGIGPGSYTGPNPIAPITMNGFIIQKAFFDTINTGISNYNSVVPDKFALYQNYPNPFNPTTTIKFDIAKSSFTSIVIYDMLGKEVSNLINQNLSPGSYQYILIASNFPSGIYYYKIETNAFTEIKKMIVLK